MPRESKKARIARASDAYELLLAEYPDAHCELAFADPFQLAVSTILSAQASSQCATGYSATRSS